MAKVNPWKSEWKNEWEKGESGRERMNEYRWKGERMKEQMRKKEEREKNWTNKLRVKR